MDLLSALVVNENLVVFTSKNDPAFDGDIKDNMTLYKMRVFGIYQ
jgi:hypothetical protein